ncbi:hypothetical protein D3Z38_03515 [Clostridiales bacterium]|nr:hypothetical protein [Clostridiales bacterium]
MSKEKWRVLNAANADCSHIFESIKGTGFEACPFLDCEGRFNISLIHRGVVDPASWISSGPQVITIQLFFIDYHNLRKYS